jgi:uncharacterized RDD family membrane protein YckC
MSQSYESAPPTGAGAASGARAGFGPRLGAYLLDLLVVGIPAAIIVIVALAISNTLGVIAYLLVIVASIAYFPYFEGGPTGQTIGKKALGIKVVDTQGGGPIGFGRGFIRLLVRWVGSIPLYLGWFWMLWDPEQQTWHDKAANTYVVSAGN